jgi:hypothetical protein
MHRIRFSMFLKAERVGVGRAFVFSSEDEVVVVEVVVFSVPSGPVDWS